jgi:hypothetical protein
MNDKLRNEAAAFADKEYAGHPELRLAFNHGVKWSLLWLAWAATEWKSRAEQECPGCFRKTVGCSSPDCPMTRRKGHSRLVWSKDAQALDAIDPNPPANIESLRSNLREWPKEELIENLIHALLRTATLAEALGRDS